jgi:hypothetical protein
MVDFAPALFSRGPVEVLVENFICGTDRLELLGGLGVTDVFVGVGAKCSLSRAMWAIRREKKEKLAGDQLPSYTQT